MHLSKQIKSALSIGALSLLSAVVTPATQLPLWTEFIFCFHGSGEASVPSLIRATALQMPPLLLWKELPVSLL